jgi:glycosyltransferase involved in cell wall biosynthesis
MRIGIEAQRIFRTKKHGMDRVALEVIRELQKLDALNDYFIFVNTTEDPCIEETKNFKIISHQAPYPIWEQRFLPKAAEDYKLDVLHCTSNTAPLKVPCRLVLTLHDIIYLEKNIAFSKGFTLYQRLGNLYRKWIVPRILDQCETIITVSEFEKNRIQEKLHLNPNKLKAIYNGLSPKFKVIEDPKVLLQVRERYNLPESYLFFFGNTDPKKNTENVLKAYTEYVGQSKAPLLLVIADYPEELVLKKLDKLNKAHLKDYFIYPGYINHDDIPAILTSASILLYPSLRESFGIPIIEGMACGTPVITSRTSSMPEVAGGAAEIVNPESPEEISTGISNILSDSDLRQQLIEKGVNRASHFSWKRTAEETHSVLISKRTA